MIHKSPRKILSAIWLFVANLVAYALWIYLTTGYIEIKWFSGGCNAGSCYLFVERSARFGFFYQSFQVPVSRYVYNLNYAWQSALVLHAIVLTMQLMKESKSTE